MINIFVIQNVIYVFMLYIQPAQSFTLYMVELILKIFINDKIILNPRTVENPIKSFLIFIQCVT